MASRWSPRADCRPGASTPSFQEMLRAAVVDANHSMRQDGSRWPDIAGEVGSRDEIADAHFILGSRKSGGSREPMKRLASVAATSSLRDVSDRGTGKRVRAKTARRREQCRVNQARYRNKQRAKETELCAELVRMHGEIQRLVERRQSLYAQVTLHASVAKQTLCVLCHCLRRGLVATGSTESSPSRAQQLACITSHVDELVQIGATYGRSSFVEQLDRFAMYWGNLRTRLCSIQTRDAADTSTTTTLLASLRLHATVTPLTIHHVFPHLCDASNHLVHRKLLGQRLACDVLVVAVCNDRGEIVRLDWSIDFVSALREFLPLAEVATVLAHARMERDAYLMEPLASCVLLGHHRYLPGRRFAHLAIE